MKFVLQQTCSRIDKLPGSGGPLLFIAIHQGMKLLTLTFFQVQLGVKRSHVSSLFDVASGYASHCVGIVSAVRRCTTP